ncbi:hypothetical protein [Neptunicoccus cionae]|uniref:Uncharacterized protein n=1 Tax=Neptunicoccus cionae TaxID=2035344 RepID=A0A916VN18_9RHOB|nr:hypothetical protein [Amylibacter cionae]GGA09819.1 hypothetical protein GCM10011498_07340 [Amylibacter cionae]
MACLGSIGLVGTALYLLFLGALSRARIKDGSVQNTAVLHSLKTACLALVISAL